MKRLGCLLCAALLLAAVAFAGNATGRFDQKLSTEAEIAARGDRWRGARAERGCHGHLGPCPGDCESGPAALR